MNRHLVSSLLILLLAMPLAAAETTELERLQEKVRDLQARVDALEGKTSPPSLDEIRRELDVLSRAVERISLAQRNSSGSPTSRVSDTDHAPAATTSSSSSTSSTTAVPPASSTTLWGYGELNYSRPTNDPASAQADLRRAVLGFGHAFSENTRVLGELEWEHAIASAGDEGEAAVEQLFIEHQLRPMLGVRAGLMLIPLGLLNEHHEPGNYYGVERNFVETAIIPSTWREGGISLFGSTASGLSWQAGVTTGFDLNKWDASSQEGRESPLGSIHQELQLARAHDPSLFASANWVGLPGLTVGAGVFTGKIGQGQVSFTVADPRLTLGEAHIRWQPGPFDVAALYARGTISDTGALNLTLVGDPTPVPESFWGGYIQAAWRIWQRGDSALAPFLRYAEYNTAASYAAIPPGLGVAPSPTERVFTSGTNYWLTDGVVFKIDYQHFHLDSSRNRIDLGMGYQF